MPVASIGGGLVEARPRRDMVSSNIHYNLYKHLFAASVSGVAHLAQQCCIM